MGKQQTTIDTTGGKGDSALASSVVAVAHQSAVRPGIKSRAELETDARALVEASKSANTQRAYAQDWADFRAWCAEDPARGCALPASGETVTLYLADRAATHAVATIERRLATISQAHQTAGYETPTAHPAVRAAWQGLKRRQTVAQEGKRPLWAHDLRAMIETLPGIEGGLPLALRDRALLLVGYLGALRRSEIVGLQIGDAQAVRGGLQITIRQSKTDQDGAGQRIGLPAGSDPLTCPVAAVRDWCAVLQAANADTTAHAPLFRAVDRHGNIAADHLTDQTVTRVIKRSLDGLGWSAAEIAAYAGHSLRAGFATQSLASGATETAIQRQTRHKSVAVLRRYFRDADLLAADNAARVIEL